MGCHRKYREGVWEGDDGLQAQLKMEKHKNPGMAAYLLGRKLDTPGAFYLGSITNTTPHREYFTVDPDGFYFRHKVSPLPCWPLLLLHPEPPRSFAAARVVSVSFVLQ